VFGNFTIFKEILQDRRFAAVVYKGSREHCDTIRKENMNVLDRELFIQSGGKNAVIVTESADVKQAVKVIFEGLVRSSGQLCSSTSRVFVAQDLLAPLSRLLDETLHEMIIGPTDDPSKPVPHMGPLYAKKAIDKFLRFQTMATREAEKTISWGKAVPGNGCFVRPGAHVFKEVDLSSAYQSNVIKSPDLAIYPYTSFDDAIQGCNKTDASLVVSIVGADESVNAKLVHFDAPHIHLNSATTESEVNLPLSGRKQSGNKRFNSLALAYYLLSPQAITAEKAVTFDGFPTHPRLA
jgi:aldehyde dehydrogenase (NAD+)